MIPAHTQESRWRFKPFILTSGYIDKVYKSVSSKRKQTRPSNLNGVFVVCVKTMTASRHLTCPN